MSKTEEEYFEAKGWSSKHFLEHAKLIFAELKKNGFELDIKRTVIYIQKGDQLVKAYVHHNGRNREWLTFTDAKGGELLSFKYTIDPRLVLSSLLGLFK